MAKRKRILSKQENKAIEIADRIEKTYKKLNVNIEIIDWFFRGERIRYEIKLKGNSKISNVFAHIKDVQSRLKFPLFQVYEENLTVYIVVSEQEITYARLPKILEGSSCDKEMDDMELPYVVGYDCMGNPVIVDVAAFPHLLLGGSTNSGKSVGLQALITSIAYTKEPSEVDFIMIDVGAGDLTLFDGLPHLSFPVIEDHEAAFNALTAVKAEMERRIKLERADSDEFEQLPMLVLVIDEFPALFTSDSDKGVVKSLVNTISDLLRRGRHGKIHLVLAAQNPIFNSMKVDLGNVTARIAFKCAKKNNSETILGEGGAENLSGKGTLLLKSPQSDGLQWIQGSYIKPEEIQEVVHKLTSRSRLRDTASKFILTIPADPSSEGNGASCSRSSLGTVAAGPSEQELLVAAVMFWAFGKEHISTNMLMNEYHLGWNRAAGLVKKLEELGIVDKAEGKRPRYVRVRSIEDIPEKMVAFMERCDYPRDSLTCAFQERARTDTADGKYPVR